MGDWGRSWVLLDCMRQSWMDGRCFHQEPRGEVDADMLS
jgi:hypothetical protein